MSGPRNIAASVKARLENVAEHRGEEFNLVLAPPVTGSNGCCSG